ncbi:MAG: hypothetical protein DIU68_019840 [Chloroflexota bacterium]|nr:MAG: hypothetical protein DIU68_15030 [Chloroflexota bacterium]
MNAFIASIDRSTLIRAVAVYLLAYALLNVCAGLVMAIAGGFAGIMGATGVAMLNESGVSSLEGGDEALAAMATATTMGGLVAIWGILALLSVPLFLVVAYGLFRRHSWARMGAVIALGVTILLSVINLGSGGLMNLLWIIVSGFVLYLFLTDQGVRQELGG